MLFFKHFPKQINISLVMIMVLSGCSFSEDETHALLREARTFESMGQFKEAEEAFKKISILKDKEPTPLKLAVLMNMANFYLRTAEFKKAINISDDALKLCDKVYGPNDPLKTSILFEQASAYEGLKNNKKAVSIYHALLDFADPRPDAMPMRNLLPLAKLGDIAVKQNDLDAGSAYYERALRLTVLPIRTWRSLNYRLAICSAALGHNLLAESYFKNSLPAGPRDPGPVELFDLYIKLLRQQYRYGSAILVLEQKENWEIRRKEYRNWLASRVSTISRFNLLDKYTEKDFFDFTSIPISCKKQRVNVNIRQKNPRQKNRNAFN
jgi:tetratricopeptide (TPR) repeat protein